MRPFRPEADDPGDLPYHAWGFREARILQVAVRLNLFSALEAAQPTEPGALAAALHADAEMVERLLVALSAMGLAVLDDDGWRNRPAASTFLVEGKAHYQGDVIRLAAEEWDRYHDLEALVRGGIHSRDREELTARQQASGYYLGALHALASAGEAQRIARLLSMMAGRRSLLDVAGAPGSYALALCQQFPVLTATVLDTESARPVTETLAARAGVADRFHYRAALWREADWGRESFDALRLGYLLGNSESESIELLVKSYEALKVGGLLIFQGYLLPSDCNDGGRAALVNVLDSLPTLEQIQSLLNEAGFERVTVLHRDGRSADVLIAYKPRDLPDAPERVAAVELAPPLETLVGLDDAESSLISRQREVWKRVIKP